MRPVIAEKQMFSRFFFSKIVAHALLKFLSVTHISNALKLHISHASAHVRWHTGRKYIFGTLYTASQWLQKCKSLLSKHQALEDG